MNQTIKGHELFRNNTCLSSVSEAAGVVAASLAFWDLVGVRVVGVKSHG